MLVGLICSCFYSRILKFNLWLSKTPKLWNCCFQRYPYGWKIQIMTGYATIPFVPFDMYTFSATPSFSWLSLFLKVDWLNKFIETMWPFLDKVCLQCIYSDVCFCCPCCSIALSSCLWALILQVLQAICKTVRETVKPIIAEQIPQYKIDSVEFEALTLGSLPPTFQGSNCSIRPTHTSMMSLLFFFPFFFIPSKLNEICLKEICEIYWNGKLWKLNISKEELRGLNFSNYIWRQNWFLLFLYAMFKDNVGE